jgi:alpha-N-arabinofuranosidase
VAALNDAGDTLTLFCVNRHLDRDLTASIGLKGFSAKANAQVQVLRSDSIYDSNDEVDPEHIVPVPGTAHVAADKVDFTFAHESVTVITLHKR